MKECASAKPLKAKTRHDGNEMNTALNSEFTRFSVRTTKTQQRRRLAGFQRVEKGRSQMGEKQTISNLFSRTPRQSPSHPMGYG